MAAHRLGTFVPSFGLRQVRATHAPDSGTSSDSDASLGALARTESGRVREQTIQVPGR